MKSTASRSVSTSATAWSAHARPASAAVATSATTAQRANLPLEATGAVSGVDLDDPAGRRLEQEAGVRAPAVRAPQHDAVLRALAVRPGGAAGVRVGGLQLRPLRAEPDALRRLVALVARVEQVIDPALV